MGVGGMHPSNVALALTLLTTLAAIVGFVAGYGLRSYISYRRHQRYDWGRRPDDLGSARN